MFWLFKQNLKLHFLQCFSHFLSSLLLHFPFASLTFHIQLQKNKLLSEIKQWWNIQGYVITGSLKWARTYGWAIIKNRHFYPYPHIMFLLAFFLYEYYFDVVYHLPIESLSLRIMLATIFKVQFSLIIIWSCYPKKLSRPWLAYTDMKITYTDSFSNLFHMLHFCTKKQAKQKTEEI